MLTQFIPPHAIRAKVIPNGFLFSYLTHPFSMSTFRGPFGILSNVANTKKEITERSPRFCLEEGEKSVTLVQRRDTKEPEISTIESNPVLGSV